ncbi:hypothetical protein MSG28_006153 [Choristoneura fumiferana]|uniref:Uncharacterized protein n=1 Tax=Choristoneura fumiferana TaxID=7141 RepID=A0ACC0JDX1_CHOFU|nr:hypothetical protein MSG28_006153 [Choristoneura fumiferana]
MLQYTICALLVISPVLCRHMPRFNELDADEQQLFRAAYDTPSYDHDEYQHENDLEPGKLDLLKDGLWAIKTKINELKAFDKAIAANMLQTKLKLKELLEYHLEGLKNKPHLELLVEKKKPSYAHPQAPAYPVAYEPQPQYAPAPAPVYHHDPYYGH